MTAVDGTHDMMTWWRQLVPGRMVAASNDPTQRTLHRLFGLGVIIKGIDGALEVVGGVLFLLVTPRTLHTMVRLLTAHEISEDPGDLVANLLRHAASQLSQNTTLFAGVYLLGHGLTKLTLVAGLLRGKLWAYPAALWFLTVFVLYQTYRIFLTYSVALAGLTAFDLVVMFLIWHEYRLRAQARATGA